MNEKKMSGIQIITLFLLVIILIILAVSFTYCYKALRSLNEVNEDSYTNDNVAYAMIVKARRSSNINIWIIGITILFAFILFIVVCFKGGDEKYRSIILPLFFIVMLFTGVGIVINILSYNAINEFEENGDEDLMDGVDYLKKASKMSFWMFVGLIGVMILAGIILYIIRKLDDKKEK